MENIHQFGSGRREVDLPDKERFMSDLSVLLKAKQSNELIGTFQAGTIPIMLDILARDTSEKGQGIVTSLFKMTESLKQYYKDREPKPEPPKVEDKKEEETVKLPVQKPP